MPLFILFVIFASLFKMFSSGYFKNILTREKFAIFKKKIINIRYKTALIIPITTMILVILAMIYTGFNFNSTTNGIFSKAEYLLISNYPLIYLLGLLTIQYLIGLFISNISLIVLNKSKNIFVGIIEIVIKILIFYFIVYMFYALFISRGLSLTNLTEYFDLMNYCIGTFKTIPMMFGQIFISLLLVVISNIMINRTYQKKEQVMLEYEKKFS